jgi:hypothetical protein
MKNPKALTFWIPKALFRPVAGKLYLFFICVLYSVQCRCHERIMIPVVKWNAVSFRAARYGLMSVEGVRMDVRIMHMRRVVACDRQVQIMDLFLCDFVL